MKQRAILVIIYGTIFLLISLYKIIFNLTDLIHSPIDLCYIILLEFIVYLFMVFAGFCMLQGRPWLSAVIPVIGLGVILKVALQVMSTVSLILEMGPLAMPLLFAPKGITDTTVFILLRLFFVAMDFIVLLIIVLDDK